VISEPAAAIALVDFDQKESRVRVGGFPDCFDSDMKAPFPAKKNTVLADIFCDQ